jgi:hypothetical protein
MENDKCHQQHARTQEMQVNSNKEQKHCKRRDFGNHMGAGIKISEPYNAK